MADDPAISDAVLVSRARQGDALAFGQLIERRYDFIFRLAWRWCGNRSNAEDVTQEVCVRLGTAIRSFRGTSAFTTWLYTLTLNVVRDMARKTAREAAKVQAFCAESMAYAEAAEEEDSEQKLWQAVRQLPDKQRDAVLLVYAEGLSHADAGHVMGISEATVSWHIHEAKKRLKVLVRHAWEV
ncbi:MAG: RNA polymerase sigma factor [Alphaproteobacteria bacterium]|nr:RNA polymerase sigma factor [Alphaproteobacteria bacterium]